MAGFSVDFDSEPACIPFEIACRAAGPGGLRP